jgi:uncharacterized membrane protein HdeD (DUF308 family)
MNGEFVSYIIILGIIRWILKFVIGSNIYGNNKISEQKKDASYKDWVLILNIVSIVMGIIFLVNVFKT